jgi:hypothetical protein
MSSVHGEVGRNQGEVRRVPGDEHVLCPDLGEAGESLASSGCMFQEYGRCPSFKHQCGHRVQEWFMAKEHFVWRSPMPHSPEFG